MKIFITGGTGFVGKYVVAELQKRGHKLLILSRRDPGSVFSSRRNLKFLRGDLSSVAKWQSKLARFKPQVALHLAWEGIPDYGFEASAKNLSQGLALISVLRTAGCKKVVGVGSCWEYGVNTGKVGEDAASKPLNAFSAAKNALYSLGREAAKEYGTKFVWARIFFVYGPGQKPSSLIPHLIAEKRHGRLPVIKNPNGGNDFVYVGDVARALRLLLEKNPPHDLYNIGSGRLTGVREVARVVYGKEVVKRKGPARGFYANIARMKIEVGWKPEVSLAAGIRATMNAVQ